MAEDFDTILASIETQKGPQCSVCQLLADLHDDPNRPKIIAALNSDREHAHIARALAAYTSNAKWASRGQSIGKHRHYHQTA